MANLKSIALTVGAVLALATLGYAGVTFSSAKCQQLDERPAWERQHVKDTIKKDSSVEVGYVGYLKLAQGGYVSLNLNGVTSAKVADGLDVKLQFDCAEMDIGLRGVQVDGRKYLEPEVLSVKSDKVGADFECLVNDRFHRNLRFRIPEGGMYELIDSKLDCIDGQGKPTGNQVHFGFMPIRLLN